MKKLFFILSFLVFMIPSASHAETRKTAVYFYADWCSHCQKVDEYFTRQGFYDRYDVKKYDFDKSENKVLLSKIFREKGVQDVGIPAIVIDEEILLGDTPIIKDFESKMEASQGKTSEFVGKFGAGKPDKPLEKKQDADSQTVPLWQLWSAALSDAFNPCAFAVLILLVGTVLKSQGKNRALFSGLLFSLAIFISYLLMGFGLYKAITVFNVPKYLSLGVGGLAILIGLANLKDAFWHGKFFVMEVPLAWRPKMQSILRRVTSPFGALIAGFLVSLFLLPCSSGPYIVIVGLLAEKVEVAKAAGQLILYNLIFVSPMVLITLGMYFFNLNMGEMDKLRKENIRYLHAAVGVVMLFMGIYLVRGWV